MSKDLAQKLAELPVDKLDEVLNRAEDLRLQQENKKRTRSHSDTLARIENIPKKELIALAKRIRALSKPLEFKTVVKPVIKISATAHWDKYEHSACPEFSLDEFGLNTDLFGEMTAGIEHELGTFLKDYLQQLSYETDVDNAFSGLKRRNDAISKLLDDLDALAEKFGVDETDIWNHLAEENRI